MNTEKNQTNNKDEEVDLGKLFELIGRGFNNLFNFIWKIFKYLFQFLIVILLFLKRNFIILILSFIVGGIIGHFAEGKTRIYTSSLIVKPNFNSTHQLYKNIKYFDDLTRQKDTVQLAKMFNLTKAEASKLKSFKINPFLDYSTNLRTYNKFVSTSDSVFASKISFKEYIENKEDYDYPYQIISVDAVKSDIFFKLTKGITRLLEKNTYLVGLKNTKALNIETEERLTNNNLEQADSLRQVYNKVKLTEAKKPFSGTNIDLAQGKDKASKELELFNIQNAYRQKLVDINNDKIENKNILNIISNFSNIGTKKSIIYRKPGEYAFLLFGLTLLGLLLVKLNKYLKNYQIK